MEVKTLQKSIEILNYQHDIENLSLKVLVVFDSSITPDRVIDAYYQKGIEIGIYPTDIEFIDYHDFLSKYQSKEDFKYSLTYSDIVLLPFFTDNFNDSFIDEYISFNDYYKEYPKLLYMDTDLGRNKYKDTRVSSTMFFNLLSHTRLAKKRNIEDVRVDSYYIHHNGEKNFDIEPRPELDASKPLNEIMEEAERYYSEDESSQKERAKKLLLVGILRDNLETTLLGIYDPKQEETVRNIGNGLFQPNTPFFEVVMMWVDAKGEELPLLTNTLWSINHYLNVCAGEFIVSDKVKLQQSLNNLE